MIFDFLLATGVEDTSTHPGLASYPPGSRFSSKNCMKAIIFEVLSAFYVSSQLYQQPVPHYFTQND